MLLPKLFHIAKNWRAELRAYFAKRAITAHVVKILENTHAQELAITPRNEWPLVRQKQIEEIKAVRSGQQFDIVDRRSWQYPYLPEALHRLNQPVLKNTPYSLRRFSETPIPRRAMNLVKNAVLSFQWKIQPIKEFADEQDPEREQRIRIAMETFKRPNNSGESFRDLQEQMIEDFLLNGQACAEHRTTPYVKRPQKFWAVDSSTIRIFLDWTESTPDRPRYAQMTGLKGERGIVTFLSDELIFIRDNIRTATPFGLGRTEIAFNSINAFLGVQDMSARAGADQVHKTWLWWEQTLNPAHVNLIRRHIINEIEGQAKLSMIAGAKAPQVIEVKPVSGEDLLMEWQKFLIQIIAAAYDLSPQALNMDDHPNRATAQVMADTDWKTAVVPVGTRFQQAWTDVIHRDFGWKDLEFTFENLNEPDEMTRTIISQRLWAMNSTYPNEIRKKFGLGPLPGPWGKLNLFQQQLILMEVQARMSSRTGGSSMGTGMGIGMGMSHGMSMGSGGSGMGGLGSGASSGFGAGSSMSFAADDIAQMSPEEVQVYQELGMLPDTYDMADQMEQQQPGVLDQLSDELTEYFKKEIAMKEAVTVQPAPITDDERQQQVQKFYEDMHNESLAEIVINRRGVFGPAVNDQVRKNPVRGKYPRDGSGGFVNNRKDLTIDQDVAEGKNPKRRYSPGKGNGLF